MNKMLISTHVTTSTALREGVATCGYAAFELSDEQIASLSADERAEVAKHLCEAGEAHGSRQQDAQRRALDLDAASVDWSTIHSAIAREVTEARDKSEAERAAREAKIVEALALPIEEWIAQGSVGPIGFGSTTPSARLPYPATNAANASSDPRVAAKLAEAKVALAPMLEEHARRVAERDAEKARIEAMRTAKEEATRARDESARAALRAFAASIPDLSRAAAEGYEVEAAVADYVAEQVEKTVRASAGERDVTTLVEDSPTYNHASWEERKAPRAAVLDVRDLIIAAVARVVRPACVVVDVSRAMRVELEGEEDRFGEKPEPARFTGIVVTISSPVTPDRCVIVSAE